MQISQKGVNHVFFVCNNYFERYNLNLAKFLMYYSRSCTVCSQILDTCMMIAKLIVWLLKLNLYIQILLLNGVESMHRRRLFLGWQIILVRVI